MFKQLGGDSGSEYMPRLQVILSTMTGCTLAPGLELETKQALFDFWTTFANSVTLPTTASVKSRGKGGRGNKGRGKKSAQIAHGHADASVRPSGHRQDGHPAGVALRRILCQACRYDAWPVLRCRRLRFRMSYLFSQANSAVLCASMLPVSGPIGSQLGFLDQIIVDDVDEFRRLRQIAASAVAAILVAVADDTALLNQICAGTAPWHRLMSSCAPVRHGYCLLVG